MKKKYSDPLMFSNVFLSGITVDPSQGGSPAPDGDGDPSLLGKVHSFTISSGDEVVGSESPSNVQIVEPDQTTESTITESNIKDIITQLFGEETESVPSDESSIAD